MYNSKISGRFQELVEGSFTDSNNVTYTVDRDGNIVRDDRFRPQVYAVRQSLNNTTKNINN